MTNPVVLFELRPLRPCAVGPAEGWDSFGPWDADGCPWPVTRAALDGAFGRGEPFARWLAGVYWCAYYNVWPLDSRRDYAAVTRVGLRGPASGLAAAEHAVRCALAFGKPRRAPESGEAVLLDGPDLTVRDRLLTDIERQIMVSERESFARWLYDNGERAAISRMTASHDRKIRRLAYKTCRGVDPGGEEGE